MTPFFTQAARYKVCPGGRGRGASWNMTRGLLTEAAIKPLRVLCTREIQASIKDSVHRLLQDQIKELGLEKYYLVQKDSIYSSVGSEFLFKGLRHNAAEVKSTEGVDRVFVEEAEKVSAESWDVLIPTIRKEGSEIWVAFNPDLEKSATYQRFVVNPPPGAIVIPMTYEDNPWFSETLRAEMEYDRRTDPEKYNHVWLGKPKRYSNALIFRGKIKVEAFETPLDARFYFGADFGFSTDPTWLGRMFIVDRTLYIDWEFYGHGVELDELHEGFHSVPGAAKWPIKADSSRPDTISFLRREFKDKNGKVWPAFNIKGAAKGKGSVEDGIQFLRGFEQIIIHPRCRGARDNFENYKWKVDRITGDILPVPAEGSDHAPDGTRYALEDVMKAAGSMFVAHLMSIEPE